MSIFSTGTQLYQQIHYPLLHVAHYKSRHFSKKQAISSARTLMSKQTTSPRSKSTIRGASFYRKHFIGRDRHDHHQCAFFATLTTPAIFTTPAIPVIPGFLNSQMPFPVIAFTPSLATFITLVTYPGHQRASVQIGLSQKGSTVILVIRFVMVIIVILVGRVVMLMVLASVITTSTPHQHHGLTQQ